MVLYAIVVHPFVAHVMHFASTLSLDFTELIDVAFTIVNSLWPLFVVPIGFMFGFALVSWIISEIRTSLPRG